MEYEIANNPKYFRGPVSGLAGQGGSHQFITMYANHSAEYPEGFLGLETLKSFFAVSGSPGHFTYDEGCERIPAHWYRRPLSQAYDLGTFAGQLAGQLPEHPNFIVMGGNTDGVNSFVAADLSDLGFGRLSADSFDDLNVMLCFATQWAQFVTTDLMTPLAEALFNFIFGLFGGACPQYVEFNYGAFEGYPGWRKGVRDRH